MEALTREATMAILKDFGMDRYGRRVVNLRANDHDVSLAGLRAGHLAAWPHRSQRALGKKPDWCQTVPTMRDPENFDN